MKSKTKRVERIFELCQKNDQLTVDQLVVALQVSPATIRRDLQEMEDMKLVHRYYGGVSINNEIQHEPTMNAKHLLNKDIKRRIAKYAASMIHDNDIVYIDAGTTTENVTEFIHAKNILVVTQALSVIDRLYEKQIKCYTLGGYLRFSTNIIIDSDTIERISKLHFSIAFLGCNGINSTMGFTTTNDIEAMLKKSVIPRTDNPFILADNSKFNAISNIKFANIDDASIITDLVNPSFDSSAAKKIYSLSENDLD